VNEFWGLFSQIGLWGWGVAVLFLIHFTFPANNIFVVRSAIKWGGLSLIFFICWITGMLFA
jgi:hypothetical protein